MSQIHSLPSVPTPVLACMQRLLSGCDLVTERNENADLTFDSLLVSHGQRQGVCGMDDMRSQGLPWLLGVLVEFRPTGTKDGDLAKLSCEIWRALAFVP